MVHVTSYDETDVDIVANVGLVESFNGRNTIKADYNAIRDSSVIPKVNRRGSTIGNSGIDTGALFLEGARNETNRIKLVNANAAEVLVASARRFVDNPIIIR